MSVFLAVLLLLMSSPAYGQAELRPSFIWGVARSTLLDPTTYVPAVVTYEATLADWKTSQPLFAHGWVEANPSFTRSGFPNDIPVSYEDGKHMILVDSLQLLAGSAVHNAAAHATVRLLIVRYPEHGRLIRTTGWIERIAFASYITYLQSSGHFQQASRNRDLVRRNGF